MAQKDQTLDIRRALAPGTRLRNAIELILRQETGALIVLGYGRDIEAICTGGLIYRANVPLIPDPSIATSETGTRHRTAERVAIQTGRPVVVVSQGRQN